VQPLHRSLRACLKSKDFAAISHEKHRFLDTLSVFPSPLGERVPQYFPPSLGERVPQYFPPRWWEYPIVSLPPCGGGLGWGGQEIPTPHPSPPPQGGREKKAQPAPTRGEGEKSTTRPHKGGGRKKHNPPPQEEASSVRSHGRGPDRSAYSSGRLLRRKSSTPINTTKRRAIRPMKVQLCKNSQMSMMPAFLTNSETWRTPSTLSLSP